MFRTLLPRLLPRVTAPKVLLTLVLALVAGGALVTPAAAQTGSQGSPTVLVVAGPPRVAVGEPAAFEVSELFSGRAVPGAYVFAFAIEGPRGAEAAFDPALADALLQPVADDAELRDDSFADWGGEFLGVTGPDGTLAHAFGWPGHRLILAVRHGAIPGYTTIEVVPPTIHALAIEGSEVVSVLDTARYRVTNRRDGTPLQHALVFAIPRGDAPALSAQPLAPLGSLEVDAADVATAQDLATLADGGAADEALALEAARRWRAIFLDSTNADGVVTHEYVDPSHYLVVAVKRQHWPAYTKTLVLPRQLVLNGPAHVRLGDPATYHVNDLTRTPTAGAYLYAFPVARALGADLDADLASALDGTEQLGSDLLAFWGGSFLGRTNARGDLTHTYRQPGGYVVVALKRSFRPDHTRTSVTANRLHIEGPGVVNAGDPARFVVGDAGGAPVARAAVFAIPRDRFPVPLADAAGADPAVEAALLEAVAADAESFRPDAVSDWCIVFVGWTDANGAVSHVFPAPEDYLVVALKRQYLPGLTRLNVVPRQLVLDAPGSVVQGETFRIAVGDLAGGPVGGALVFAFPLPLASVAGEPDALSDGALSERLEAAVVASDAAALDISARWHGYLLGRTNDEGLLKAQVDAAGPHLLVAVRRGFRHARARIEVVRETRQLAIAGPGLVEVGAPAQFKVSAQRTQQPVARAAVYAVPLPALLQPQPADALTAPDIAAAEALLAEVGEADGELSEAAVVRWQARFLGWTDEHGSLVAKFGQSGRYLIIAIKPGYAGAYTHLAVVPPPQLRQLVVHGPGSVLQAERATFEVTEATTGAPVPRVAMYAIPHHTPIAAGPGAAPAAADLAAAEALLAEVAPSDERLAEAVVVRWQARFLGWTDEHGSLTARFEATGRYSIVGVRAGYLPGSTQLAVLPAPPHRQLEVHGPASVEQGAPATFRVSDGGGAPIGGAHVWGIHLGAPALDGAARPDEAAVAEALAAQLPSGADADAAGALLSASGAVFLGETDDGGAVTHRFARSGRYLIVAFRPDFLPGFTFVTVTPRVEVRALHIVGPGVVAAGEATTFRVSDGAGNPVAEALVVAWPADQPLPLPLEVPLEDAAAGGGGGILLGWTNGRGALTASFERPGSYVVYALKTGYLLGVTRLEVLGDRSFAPQPAPAPLDARSDLAGG